jgi:Bacterial protein of unknown function (DUF885)
VANDKPRKCILGQGVAVGRGRCCCVQSGGCEPVSMLNCDNFAGMSAKTRALFLGVCVLLGPLHVFASTPPSVESRIAAQNALFEEQFQSQLKAHPQFATAIGDYRYNDQLDEGSLAAIENQHSRDEAFLARLNAIPTAGLPEQDALSHEVMIRNLQQRIDDYYLKEYEMPVSHRSGPQVVLADLPLAVPFDSVKRYEDFSGINARNYTILHDMARAGIVCVCAGSHEQTEAHGHIDCRPLSFRHKRRSSPDRSKPRPA